MDEKRAFTTVLIFRRRTSYSEATLIEAELPEEKIKEGLTFFNALGNIAKVGYRMALANCGCHACTEILGRIEFGDLR